MKHCKVELPKNIKKVKVIFDLAKSKAFNFWIDEKDTSWKRQISTKSYEEAFHHITNNTPYITCLFRNDSYIAVDEPDHWEFGMSDLGSGINYFIWIKVSVEIGNEIIKKYKLKENWY